MTPRMRRLLTVRYTNRLLYRSELDWPLEQVCVLDSPPSPGAQTCSSGPLLGAALDDGEPAARGPLVFHVGRRVA